MRLRPPARWRRSTCLCSIRRPARHPSHQPLLLCPSRARPFPPAASPRPPQLPPPCGPSRLSERSRASRLRHPRWPAQPPASCGTPAPASLWGDCSPPPTPPWPCPPSLHPPTQLPSSPAPQGLPAHSAPRSSPSPHPLRPPPLHPIPVLRCQAPRPTVAPPPHPPSLRLQLRTPP